MAHDITIVTQEELQRCVRLDLAAVDAVQRAFEALAGGEVIMPPVMSMDIPGANAEVDVKTAYIPGFEGFAIKVSPGFFDNPSLGLPSLNGLMILFNARTGLVDALFLDNGYLTDVRTAAAGAVAARHLAPDGVETAGVIGTGVQARLQMQAAFLVRPFKRVLVWGRDSEKAQALAAELAGHPGGGGARRERPPGAGRAIPARRHRDPLARAACQCRVAAPAPAHHGDGGRPARQERDRSARARARRRLRVRPAQPVRGDGRIARRHLRRRMDRRRAARTGRSDRGHRTGPHGA